jgi:hypothetical protein
MKGEIIIKILLFLGIIYLLINCSNDNEKFTDQEQSNFFKLSLKSGNETYSFINFSDLKDEYKILFLKNTLEEFNNKPTAQNSFLNFPLIETRLKDYLLKNTLEELNNTTSQNSFLNFHFTKENVSKMPVFIVTDDKVNIYANKLFNINRPSKGSEKLKTDNPEIGAYMYWSSKQPILFYSNKENIDDSYRINGSIENNNIFKINNREDITPKRIVKKILRHDNLTFEHYVLSNNEGSEFQWKWY